MSDNIFTKDDLANAMRSLSGTSMPIAFVTEQQEEEINKAAEVYIKELIKNHKLNLIRGDFDKELKQANQRMIDEQNDRINKQHER